jgi:hypothetical protein
VIRFLYIGLAGLLCLVPLGVVWSAEGPSTGRVSTTGGHSRSTYYHSHTYYSSGGRGGWLGSSYGWGHGSYDDVGGSSSYRGGGPGGGGK